MNLVRAFFPKSGHFSLNFEKGQGVPPPPPPFPTSGYAPAKALRVWSSSHSDPELLSKSPTSSCSYSSWTSISGKSGISSDSSGSMSGKRSNFGNFFDPNVIASNIPDLSQLDLITFLHWLMSVYHTFQ